MAHMPTTDQPDVAAGVPNTRKLNATAPVRVDGGASADLTADRTVSLAPLGVTAALLAADAVTTAKVADNAVTLAKLADVATARLLGRSTAGTGDPEALTGTQATALLDTFSSSTKGLVPASGASAGLTALLDNGSWGTISSGYVTPEQYGAVGDGVTDDRPAIMLAVAAATALGGVAAIKFGAGKTYFISESILIENVRGIQVWGSNSEILFPSNDPTLVDVDAEHASRQRQSGIYLHNAQACTIRDLRFRGTGADASSMGVSVGAAVMLRRCVNTTIVHCQHELGGGIYSQDAVADSLGGSNSKTIAVSAGVVTLTDSGSLFHGGMVGAPLFIAGCNNPANDGQFYVASVISATQITYANVNAINETSTFRWSTADGDRGTLLESCVSRNPRAACAPGGFDTTFRNCRWEYGLDHADLSGLGDYLTVSGTTVTLTDPGGRFRPGHHGRPITITGATSSANNVTAILSYISPLQVSFTNASGVTERYPGSWRIAAGEKVGKGVGVGGLVYDGSTHVTITAASPVFTASDVGRAIRLLDTTSSANDVVACITSVASSTIATFQNAGGVTENYGGYFTIDTWDRVTDDAGLSRGSTHSIYIFAGRTNVKILGCSFTCNRTTTIKVSGSALPILDVLVDGCTFTECGEVFEFGADDVMDHSVAKFVNNTIIDCGTDRAGWATGALITVLGSRFVRICDNDILYTRDHSSEFDNTGHLGGALGISVKRYYAASQPVEDVIISGNTFRVDRKSAKQRQQLQTAIYVRNCGQLNSWGPGGTLTKQSTSATITVNAAAGTYTRSTGSWITDGYVQGGPIVTTGFTNAGNNASKTIASVTASVITVTSNAGLVNETKAATSTNNKMTLSDGNAYFSIAGDPGKSITLVNSATGANDGTFVVESVPLRTLLTFTNAAGVSGATTWRLLARRGTGSCVIENNYIADCAQKGIITENCIAPEVRNNRFEGLYTNYWTIGDCTPRITGNRELSTSTLSATFAIGDSGASRVSAWPIFHDNAIVNPRAGGAVGDNFHRDIGIAVGGSLRADFPILGKQGKVRPSGGYEEIVFAYGDDLADGDRLIVSLLGAGTTLTYKTTAPGALQFNSFSGLLTLLNAIAGLAADDYGTSFAVGAVVTQHIRLRRTVQSTTNGNLTVESQSLNPTALVVLCNDTIANTKATSRGCASAGPTANRTVIWSPMCSWTGVAVIVPDNAAGRTALAGGPAMHVKNDVDAGCCDVMQHDVVAGGEEFRFLLGGN
jgi:hypothetical protein